MGSDAKKAYGAVGRDELLWMEPEKLVIIEDDPEHPLYDERAMLPLEESMVLNIMVHGIIEPVVIRKNGERADGTPIVEVVAGRRRVRHVREANRRLVREGSLPHRVPCVRRKGDDDALMDVMISENEHRVADSPIVKAQKMARLASRGRSPQEIANVFGFKTTQTVGQYLNLLEADNAVKKELERGTVSFDVAAKVAKLPKEKQKDALAEMIASGATKGKAAQAAVEQAKNGKPAVAPAIATARPKSAAYMRKLAAALEVAEKETKDPGYVCARDLVRWLLGEKVSVDTEDDVFPTALAKLDLEAK